MKPIYNSLILALAIFGTLTSCTSLDIEDNLPPPTNSYCLSPGTKQCFPHQGTCSSGIETYECPEGYSVVNTWNNPGTGPLCRAALGPDVVMQDQLFELDVIYRDFPANAYGFEMFDQARGANGRCAEKWNCGSDGITCTNSSVANRADGRDEICFTGNLYHSCDKGGSRLIYGSEEGNGCGADSKRGYFTGPDAFSPQMGKCWAQPVLVTRDMVQKQLDYSQCPGSEYWKDNANKPEYIKGRYCARPLPTANARCYGEALELWFSDEGWEGVTPIRIDAPLEFAKVAGTANTYKVEYDHNTRTNWGCGYITAGFFPLDKYNCGTGYGGTGTKTYGRETYQRWCNGAPCTSGYDNELHNYGFSMAGSAEFGYKAGNADFFKFIGDDDMWIFVDGVLFEDPVTGAHADLGGNHLAAPAMIDIASLAAQKGWADGTNHVINFFYMERQSDGSNLKIEMSLSELSAGRYCAN